ncbi:Ankyrin repeat domain containing protein [Balamuthia mandrillaris]
MSSHGLRFVVVPFSARRLKRSLSPLQMNNELGSSSMDDLPDELLVFILNDLLPEGLGGLASQVCHRWRRCIHPHRRNRIGVRAFLACITDISKEEEDKPSDLRWTMKEYNVEPRNLWGWIMKHYYWSLFASRKIETMAAETGRLDVLQAMDCKWWLSGSDQGLSNAARGGHLEVLKWALADADQSSYSTLVAWKAVCKAAATAGHTHLLCWAVDVLRNPYQVLSNETAECAALAGHVETLQWMNTATKGLLMPRRISCKAAKGGYLSLLQWVVEELNFDPSGDTNVFCCAARGGSLEVLQWLCDRGASCSGKSDACAAAAKGGHAEVLKWLLSKGGLLDESVFHNAAKGGQVTMLQWLWENNCPWSRIAFRGAVDKGRVEAVRWLYDLKGPQLLQESDVFYVMDLAAQKGNLEVLKFLRTEMEPPFPWSVETSNTAVFFNNFELLRWMRDEAKPPCPWDESTSLRACQRGHYTLLHWMLTIANPPCPASARTRRRLRSRNK